MKEKKWKSGSKWTKKFYCKKFRLANDYEHESEEKEKKKQSYKTPDKKEPPKKPTNTDAKKFNELINKEETYINSELFRKSFSLQRPSDMLKAVYTTNNRRKNENLVNVIKGGLSDLKNEFEKMSSDENETEKRDKIADIVEKNLEFNRQNQEEKGLKILTPD